jgi:hypothetical protein
MKKKKAWRLPATPSRQPNDGSGRTISLALRVLWLGALGVVRAPKSLPKGGCRTTFIALRVVHSEAFFWGSGGDFFSLFFLDILFF